jgi:glycosyltransferase involved in cell wall biosynthesis
MLRGLLRSGRRRASAENAGYPALLELAREGPAPLSSQRAKAGARLRIATIIPAFRRGSGGHRTIAHLLEALRARGHEVSVWLDDGEGRHASDSPALTKRTFREFFGAPQLELATEFTGWEGADVVLATGWQTVARALLLEGAACRAYLVQDHEPEFYGASAESLWAAQTYGYGLHCIAASPWLASVLSDRYGASATHFDLAVDHDTYRARASDAAEERSRDAGEPALVAFYARAVTPRRAVPLGLLALAELQRRRADVEIALYGEDRPLRAPFPHRNLGMLDGAGLAALYRKADVGMVLSLTNPSLVALEMMACGLPCVELASDSILAGFGAKGPLTLAGADPLALCAGIERLLDDPGQRAEASRRGIELMATRTWEKAAAQVEEGLYTALELAANADARAG